MTDFIPQHLAGTPVGELIAELRAAARARNLFVKREWAYGRYGGQAVWTVFRGNEPLARVAIDGAEGKTLRAKSSGQLRELLETVLAVEVPGAEELPTEALPGAYLLTDTHRTQLHAWGVTWDRERGVWLAPPARLAEVTAYLESRRAEKIGRLSRDHEDLLRHLVRETERHQGREYEWTVLATALPAWREAVRRRETWVDLGSSFPRSANDELRCLGARWNGSGWAVRLQYEDAAREIIARHQERERAAAQAARAAEQAAGIVRWSRGEGYGGEWLAPGTLVHRPTEGGWFVVTECRKDYYREEGMSFGVGDDSGHVYHYAARPAQPEEYAAAVAHGQAVAARRAAIREYEERFNEIERRGTYDRSDDGQFWDPEGETIPHPTTPQNIYGGGSWIVIGADRIWAVRNNGMDGDNWARNNVRTGGAGAVGVWVPLDPDLAEQLRDAVRRAAPVAAADYVTW